MLQILKENWLILSLFIILGVLFLYFKYKENENDKKTEYTMNDIGGVFYSLENGETWFVFKYNKMTQQNKLNFILRNVLQGDEVINEYGYKYVISELINNEYYDRDIDSNGKVIRKDGPYVVYKVIPKTAMKQSNITVERNSGAVQITTDNSTAYQSISNSDFVTKISNYREILINNGISEEDINIVLNNPKDEDVKKSFLSKYGIDLAKIMIEAGGIAISFLSYLKG